MAGELTWYDILDVLPDSPAGEVQRAFDVKAGVLRPELISGAPSNVVTAAARAHTAIEAARDVLVDPASRRRYDDELGIRQPGGGLSRPELVPSEGGWDPLSSVRGAADGEALMDTLGVVADWLAPHPALPRRVTVPDVRGLFAGPCRLFLARRGLRIEVIRLTQDPMPVEGLVVGQSPPPGARVRRSVAVTAQVWHPARPRGQCR
jgi:hypothetical protein